jgi:cell division protein FtsA
VIAVAEGEMPQAQSLNRKVLHSIPLSYKLDGKPVLGRPLGLKGNKLDVKMLFVTCLEHHLNDLVATVEESGIEVLDVMAAPLAASLVTVSKTQKIAGCVLANIGSETVSIVVYENSLPISLEIFPIGGTDITNDIALGLKIPLEDAETVKLRQSIDSSVPRKKLEEIVTARLSDIFDLIEAHLKKIGKAGLLPAGIILTGGGSGLETIEDLAKAALKLPSRIATMRVYGGDKITEVKDASWSVAYGLCLWGLSNDDETMPPPNHGKTVLTWLKQFLP